jgi:hypothetical protein
MARLGDFVPVDEEGNRYPASGVAPSEAVANIVAEGLDPNYKGMPSTSTSTPWILYILIALAIYFLGGED